jgi:hypothetical protein
VKLFEQGKSRKKMPMPAAKPKAITIDSGATSVRHSAKVADGPRAAQSERDADDTADERQRTASIRN